MILVPVPDPGLPSSPQLLCQQHFKLGHVFDQQEGERERKIINMRLLTTFGEYDKCVGKISLGISQPLSLKRLVSTVSFLALKML